MSKGILGLFLYLIISLIMAGRRLADWTCVSVYPGRKAWLCSLAPQPVTATPPTPTTYYYTLFT